MTKGRNITSWIAQIVAAVILGMAIPPKFTGAEAAVGIFEELGAEPWGRYAVALFETLAVILLLVPRTAVFGGLLTVGLMIGAAGSHLTVLGIGAGDGMFYMGLVALAAGATVVALRRDRLPIGSAARGESHA